MTKIQFEDVLLKKQGRNVSSEGDKRVIRAIFNDANVQKLIEDLEELQANSDFKIRDIYGHTRMMCWALEIVTNVPYGKNNDVITIDAIDVMGEKKVCVFADEQKLSTVFNEDKDKYDASEALPIVKKLAKLEGLC